MKTKQEKKPCQGTESGSEPKVIDVEQLFKDCSEVFLRLGRQKYRLRLTRAGKLLLMK